MLKHTILNLYSEDGTSFILLWVVKIRDWINATEMGALRRSARISKLDRKTNEFAREKMNAQDMILD